MEVGKMEPRFRTGDIVWVRRGKVARDYKAVVLSQRPQVIEGYLVANIKTNGEVGKIVKPVWGSWLELIQTAI